MTELVLNATAAKRFWAKVTCTSGCWWWTGALRNGYGVIKLPARRSPTYAHRLAYLLAFGVDPGSLFVCHTCDQRRCVRPEHLFLGTSADNMRDARMKGRVADPPPALRGTAHHLSKLTPAAIDVIRATPRRYGSGRQLARRFGVSESTISCVRRGLTWRHIPAQFKEGAR